MEETRLADGLTDHLQRSAQGSLILVIGQVTSTIITAIAMILVARILGSTSYGQLAIATIPISIASMFTDLGIGSGLVKYIAQYRMEGRKEDIRTLLAIGLAINTAAGLALMSIIFFSSGYFAKSVFNRSEIQLLIQVASVNLLAQSLIKTARSVFIGFERMEFISLTTIIQSVLKSVLAPLLVFLGLGAFGAALGQATSLVITGAICLTLVITAFYKRERLDEPSLDYMHGTKLLIIYGFPLFLSVLLGGVLSQVYYFLTALYVDTYYIGNFHAATNFSVIIAFFTMPISTVLFPLFSKLDYRENDKLVLVYQNSIKYAALIVVPVASILMLLSEPIVQIIYGADYPKTAYYLSLYCINYLFVGVGQLVNSNLLNGQGKTRVVFVNNALALCVGLPLSFLLIPRFGITGLILTSIIAPKVSLLYSLWWIRKNFGFSLKFRASAKIYLSSAISFVAVYYLLTALNLGEWPSLMIGGVLFVLLYLFLILGFRTLMLNDIQDLKRILGTMGPLTPIFNFFLTFFERTLKK